MVGPTVAVPRQAREYYLLFEELRKSYGHLAKVDGFNWHLKTHQSAWRPKV